MSKLLLLLLFFSLLFIFYETVGFDRMYIRMPRFTSSRHYLFGWWVVVFFPTTQLIFPDWIISACDTTDKTQNYFANKITYITRTHSILVSPHHPPWEKKRFSAGLILFYYCFRKVLQNYSDILNCICARNNTYKIKWSARDTITSYWNSLQKSKIINIIV